jgi:DnaJ domain
VNIPDPYKVLQVDPEAEDEVIEAAYRRLAKKYHPDVSPGPDAQERMVRINQAWEMLKEPVRRAAVDRARTRSAGAAARVAADEGRARAASRGPAHAAARPARPASSAHGAGHAAGPPPTWAFPGMADPGDGDFKARPQYVSPNWTTGRSQNGHGYDPGTMGSAQGDGAAGPPPGNPSGSLLTFGRYAGWSLGEIARTDLEYLEWLDRMPIGRTYQAEIDGLLRAHRRRATAPTAQDGQRGLFRRR